MSEVERFWNGSEWQVKSITKELIDDVKCLVCGDDPTAYWHGPGGVVAICYSCAVKKLPLLIADAIAGSHLANTLTAQKFEPAVPQITGAFWRGAAFALSRRTRPGFTKDQSLSDPQDNFEEEVDPPVGVNGDH